MSSDDGGHDQLAPVMPAAGRTSLGVGWLVLSVPMLLFGAYIGWVFAVLFWLGTGADAVSASEPLPVSWAVCSLLGLGGVGAVCWRHGRRDQWVEVVLAIAAVPLAVALAHGAALQPPAWLGHTSWWWTSPTRALALLAGFEGIIVLTSAAVRTPRITPAKRVRLGLAAVAVALYAVLPMVTTIAEGPVPESLLGEVPTGFRLVDERSEGDALFNQDRFPATRTWVLAPDGSMSTAELVAAKQEDGWALEQIAGQQVWCGEVDGWWTGVQQTAAGLEISVSKGGNTIC